MIILVYTEKNIKGNYKAESLKLIELAEELCEQCRGQIIEVVEGSADELEDMIKVSDPDVILFTSNDTTKDIASRLAVRLNTGVTADCLSVRYDAEDGKVHWVRPVYDNALLAETVIDSKPQIGLMKITCQDPSLKWTENIPIEEAEIVVCAGRGCGNGKGLDLVRELAKTLGAAVGATRAVTDAGWLPISKQIGQTGKYIHPRIYIGVGVGGAIQHLAGMRNSDIIIAVNKDPYAPIFEHADYGIVGDLYTVLPIMIEHFKEKQL